MRTIGNILWFIFGGLIGGLAWIFAGCIWCITIIGIPVGLQCFKFATLAFWPFGKEIVYGNGTWKPDSWLYMVYYDSWNSIWKAVFQDGKTLFHAIWCECDRIKEKIKKNLFNWINRNCAPRQALRQSGHRQMVTLASQSLDVRN